MKKPQNILSGFLAVVVLMSSISHSINFHICGGKIQSMAVFGKAKTCVEHASACSHHDEAASMENKGCCENATVLLDSDKFAGKIAEKATVENFQFIFLPSHDLILQINPTKGSERVSFLKYKPPLIERDINVLVQTFLI